jgi:hypothetical protein
MLSTVYFIDKSMERFSAFFFIDRLMGRLVVFFIDKLMWTFSTVVFIHMLMERLEQSSSLVSWWDA